MGETRKPTRGKAIPKRTGFSAEEREAMKERAREVSKEARGRTSVADDEREVLAKIAELEPPEREMATRLHEIIKERAPNLTPKTWYGMPGWARNGKVLCLFTSASKFKTRYATLGFNEAAKLDDGNMWPTSFALLKLTPAEEARISDLVGRAAR